MHTNGTLERLAGNAGAGNSAEKGGLRRAHVIAIETGDGEGLQDVKFDQFHGFKCLGLGWRYNIL